MTLCQLCIPSTLISALRANNIGSNGLTSVENRPMEEWGQIRSIDIFFTKGKHNWLSIISGLQHTGYRSSTFHIICTWLGYDLFSVLYHTFLSSWALEQVANRLIRQNYKILSHYIGIDVEIVVEFLSIINFYRRWNRALLGHGAGATRTSITDLIHKSKNAPVPYPTMLHSEQKCARFYRTDTTW